MEPASPHLRPFCVMWTRVPDETRARIAARFAMPGFELSGFEPADPAALPSWADALLLEQADRDRLREAFDRNPFLTVELGEGGDEPAALREDWTGAPAVEPGFYLSLTTGTAYGLQCAVLVCDELARRGGLRADQRSNVELCLHEAIANAIVHGNLGLSSATKNQPDGYRLFGQMLRDRLEDPAIKRRRIDIFCRWNAATVAIAVVDQGGGFDSGAAPAAVGGKARSGRGFVFMRALASRVAVTDGGRCTVLHFDL
ncbi:anti-sigma regulatory factor (Ser/Thr protein kinase) [Azospirillum agricola]|uniref:ATP-binding protein n=1 Tax=Azospirillum agricola TaxID=1720247 RepID=UPI002D7EBA69|nr:ATP-binding protein [Azospirillum agricola]MBP2231304.1 anti-sigma regulatory factor (Ser/Thr protein kinase) [Azospirillum agricola]